MVQRRHALVLAAWSADQTTALNDTAFQLLIDDKLDELVNATFAAFQSGVRPVDLKLDAAPAPLSWSFMASLFFTTTVITTVGAVLLT